MGDVLVPMEGIEKSFPGVHALSDARFELRTGEVHALVGENGAGKSTLMKMLAGVYAKDAGRILFKGAEVDIPNPRAAQQLGISMIHQELNLMPHLTVAQNIFIGREPRAGLPLRARREGHQRHALQLFDMMHLKLDPRIKVADLTVAKQQMVEIAKALSFNSDVLIMDEPTAALTEYGDRRVLPHHPPVPRAGRGHRPHLAPPGGAQADLRSCHRHARRPLHRHGQHPGSHASTRSSA